MVKLMNILRRRRNQGLKNRLVFVMLLTYLMPAPSQAVNMSQLKRNSGFRAMVIAIANMNIAMLQATLNPHDKTRRHNVAVAYSMMPLAITALAKEFKSNKLHDDDFQFVQGILGGFVQKDLHSKVEEFMKNPSQQNIPQVGASFPQEALKQAEETYIVANREKSLLNITNEDGTPKQVTPGGPSDLADLNSRSIGQSAQASRDSKSKANENYTIVANKSKSLLNSSEQDESSLGGSQKFKEEISQDVLRAESIKPVDRNPASAVRNLTPASSQEDGLDKEFFKDKKKPSSKEVDKNPRKPRRGNRLKTSQNFSAQRTHLVSYLLKALTRKAAASGGTPAPGGWWQTLRTIGAQALHDFQIRRDGFQLGVQHEAARQRAAAHRPGDDDNPRSPCQNGDCGGGGGGGGGGGAADILFGLAAMIAAAAPMVAAGVQANTDKQIAQTNANTAMTNANTQAQLQKYTVDQQTGLAQFQAEATQKIAAEKNNKEMHQLGIQLNELKNSREQQAALVREERQLAQYNLEREIELQQQLAQQRIQEAQRQRLSDEVAQGLSTNLQNVRDPGQRLEISRVPVLGGTPGAQPSTAIAGAGSNLSRLGNSARVNGPQLGGGAAGGVAGANPSLRGGIAISSTGQALKTSAQPSASLQTITSSRALKSNPNSSSAQTLLVSAQAGGVQIRGANFNPRAALSSSNLKGRGIAQIALGSTRALKQRIKPAKNEPLEIYENSIASVITQNPSVVSVVEVRAGNGHGVLKTDNQGGRGIRKGGANNAAAGSIRKGGADDEETE